MIVTIVRHGQAGDAARDEARILTDKGTDDISFGCHRLRDLCGERSLPLPNQIFHSSWRRTTQTAEIIEASFAASIDTWDSLLPSGTVADVDRALTRMPEGSSHCVLVGHQPMVSMLVDHYLAEPGRVPSLSPGGFVSLELDTAALGCGSLLFWALPPEYRGES
jgi:phosphohistidine phosphatase